MTRSSVASSVAFTSRDLPAKYVDPTIRAPSGASRSTNHVLSNAMHASVPVQLSTAITGTHVPAKAFGPVKGGVGVMGVDVPHAVAHAHQMTITRRHKPFMPSRSACGTGRALNRNGGVRVEQIGLNRTAYKSKSVGPRPPRPSPPARPYPICLCAARHPDLLAGRLQFVKTLSLGFRPACALDLCRAIILLGCGTCHVRSS